MNAFLQAIARMEGWNREGSLCRRNNNPGNIEAGRFAMAHGSTGPGEGGRFARFPTPEVGFAALAALLSGPAYAGLTVAEAIARYAPASENDTARYVECVCDWAGCKDTDHVGELVRPPATTQV